MYYQQGLIRFLILLVIAVIILSVAGVSLDEVFGNKLVHSNFGFIFKWSRYIYDRFLEKPINITIRLWKDLVWDTFLQTIDNLRQGRNAYDGIIPPPTQGPVN